MSFEIFSFLKIYGIDMQIILTLEVVRDYKNNKREENQKKKKGKMQFFKTWHPQTIKYISLKDKLRYKHVWKQLQLII